MDWTLAIERNREALKSVLAMLVAMVGTLDVGSEPSAAGARRSTLPRHLHRFVLRLLRPAEAAARRLIIVAARGLVVEPPPPRLRIARPKPVLNRRNGFGTGVVIRPGPLPDWAQALAPKRSSAVSLPLFDPLRRFGVRRRSVKLSDMPRIRSFDDPRISFFQQPRAPDPLPPSPDDPLDAGRLHRRLDAIGRVLDDLPRQAKRLARWQARREAAMDWEANGTVGQAANLPPCGGDVRQDRGGCDGVRRDETTSRANKHSFQRFSPMRPGRPPGWRRRPTHQVYDVLNELHGLAVWAQDPANTS